jgi:acetyl esterase/lipase
LISLLHLRRHPPGAPIDITLMRAELEAVVASLPPPSGVRFEAVRMGSVPALIIEPENPQRFLFYLHGGGYLLGSARTHADVVARLAWISTDRNSANGSPRCGMAFTALAGTVALRRMVRL